jgi:hypothetical protein
MAPAAAMKWLGALLLGSALGAGAIRLAIRPNPTSGGPGETETALVQTLLAEDLSNRTFSFAEVARATSSHRVLPLGGSPAHRRVLDAIERALEATLAELNAADSPVRKLRRINEASRFFEDGLRARLDAEEGIACRFPPTRSGKTQRSGYPDLEIADEASGLVFYLDPKLVERASLGSTLRTFYFEPKDGTLKITRDAVHLLVGIEHDGRAGQWTFTGWRIVDLSDLRVRLKAEFQASNADLYRETGLSMPGGRR